MADETQIINGSFKDIPIAIDSGSLAGGRKVSVKEFPSRDTQSVEDLGLQPRKYSLEIIVSQKTNQSYIEYRNSLLAALESKVGGVLIHPLYGRIEDIVAVSYSLNESFVSYGDTTVSVNFEVNNNTGIPQSSGNVITQIVVANDAVVSAVETNIADSFKVTEAFAGNFAAGAAKVNGIIDSSKGATSFIGEAADTLDEFSALTGELSSNVNSLVSDPLALAQSFTGLLESVNGLYASASATFETFTGFFGFGSDDTEIAPTTAGLTEQKENDAVLNGAVTASALAYAYLAASSIDFKTTREIDSIAAQLDSQYASAQIGGSSQAVKDAITDMRIKVLNAFEISRVTASQIVTVDTLPTTARLLAFSYYGNDTRGREIIDLNSISDVSFVEGSVEVLTA